MRPEVDTDVTIPYVISINSVSGGGKTTVARLVQESLSAVLFCFDDFDDTNVHPDDLYEWTKRGGNLLEFDCPGMVDAVEQVLKQDTITHVVLDYPFGRDHPRFCEIIDLAVFIDTPLDVAMARRILRDYAVESVASPDERLESLRVEMAHYLEKARYPYLDTNRHKETSDLILDGCNTPAELRDGVLARVSTTASRRR